MNWKVVFGFLFVSLLSAGIALGTYSYLNKNGEGTSLSALVDGFEQKGFYPVGHNKVAAENLDFILAAEQSVNAVVHIKSVAKPAERANNTPSPGGNRNRGGGFDPFEFFFGQSPQFQREPQPRVGFGSGVIISTDGYIITNNHVIAGADEIEVTTNDNQVYTAKLIGGDESSDIALLKIEGNSFPVIPFGDSDALRVGEWVLAVGNPFNLTSTVTAGIVSAKGRGSVFPGRSTQDKVQSFIQTDAAVNPGNSGGALVNTRGELVGINTAIYSETGNFVGYSFAVPINLVRKVISDLREHGMVQRALLGVMISDLPVLKEQEPETYAKLKVSEGVYVAGFSSNSPAEKAGIKVGDVITAINGTKVRNFQELKAQLSLYSPGNVINVQVQRGDDVMTLKVELKNDQGTTATIKNRSVPEILGATLKELSPEMKQKAGVMYGVEVTEVKNGKLKAAGIKEGFIILTANETRIESPEMLNKIIESVLKKDPDERGLYIRGLYPNDKVRFFAIDLND